MKINITLNLDVERLSESIGETVEADNIEDAVIAELGWLEQSGMTLDSMEIVD